MPTYPIHLIGITWLQEELNEFVSILVNPIFLSPSTSEFIKNLDNNLIGSTEKQHRSGDSESIQYTVL